MRIGGYLAHALLGSLTKGKVNAYAQHETDGLGSPSRGPGARHRSAAKGRLRGLDPHSLIWYPFGLREEKDITFDVEPIYKSHGIEFIHAEVTGFDPPQNRVLLKAVLRSTTHSLIGTGPKVDYDYIPGLRENSHSIVGLAVAQRTREAGEESGDPGPVVIASAQGAGSLWRGV